MPRSADTNRDLAALARLHGVATRYTTDLGQPVDISPDTLRAVLAALGADTSSSGGIREALAERQEAFAHRLLPPTVVLRAGRPPTDLATPPGAELWIETEQGTRHGIGALGKELVDLPIGRHVLHAERGGRAEAVPLLVAPERLAGPGRRHWGFLVQLYSLLSHRSWGLGDLGDLAELASWAGGLGAGFVLLNPLHAYVPGPLPDPSPYRPSSRRHPDPMNLCVEAVAEFAELTGDDRAQADRLLAQARELNKGVQAGALIDREAARSLKLQALELVHQVPLAPAREQAYRRYVEAGGRGLDDFALWCALAEVHGPRWRSWPDGLRTPDGIGTAAARAALGDRVAFHRWLAWQVDEQLDRAQLAATEAGMAIGLMHDLAVGVDPEGADAWCFQPYLAGGMTVGCPPDDFNRSGQDWGLPPWRPDTLAASGYAPFAEVVRATLRRSGALRLDHVMGLFRLWWIPEGAPADQGTYVRYDHEALLGVLALEAHRAGSIVIGEDLGTVEPGVREELTDRGILGTSVLRFEYAGGSEERSGPLPAEEWRADCLATLTTHDLPSTAAWLDGEHLRLHQRLGLLTQPVDQAEAAAAAEREGWLAELGRCGLLEPDHPSGDADSGAAPGRETLALHRFLARTPAKLLGVWLPDTVGDRRPQNLPGTSHEYPNWRLPVADSQGSALTLEDVRAHPGPSVVADLYRDL
ncbi:4-alpha-glucanotransferase [Kitasatospora sp. GP82]|uniref:4-alpha-glucanotransferase n=1 Tax=Kitasatospora sp. GP82 TaxID=3035089 RepID=UPI00247315C1|nr:4-alpha-glucanotransferase [Kitasatospora sp. GP82]MDH6128383.1 4-alpha-glucanotransferase [Kitasatospora sp. GP82]